MSKYVPTIGLEIHAELKTRTKMFCRSKNDSNEERPNVNVCPVCLAHPGTLPVINREAVRHVLRVGLALKGKLADYTEFDRKNYFYPDLPKGYQLSQYEYPLVSGGELASVRITRVHLEEDTASSMHDDAAGTTSIDYNRAGVPLMELVTEPVVESAEQAGIFARELQTLLRCLGASDANMEKGEMRVEANVSMSIIEDGKKKFGTKVEVKNLNSFRAMERAVAYEIRRQTELLERGERVLQETRGWDDGKQRTFAQRIKEGSADYRYFPDPDLPSLRLSEISELSEDILAADMPELPWKKRERYRGLGISAEDADLFVREPALGLFFDAVVDLYGKEGEEEPIKLASNYLANDLVKIIRDIEGRDSDYQSEMPISASNFKKILDMVREKRISSRLAKDMLVASSKGDIDPDKYASEHNVSASGTDLGEFVEGVLSQHASVAEEYRKGKAAALEFLVGQVMRSSRGGADPAKVRHLIQERLGR